ncbi:MAG TPA: hypothetical protein VK177_16375 [Flavobacteriales bacterium]|nr:hypothetical protein [Flavobacteriales bacterium]
MHTKKIIAFLPVLALFLQSCSWIVPFYIINNTNKTVQVEVSLMDLAKGIPIFDNASGTLTAYGVDKRFSIDYDKPLSLSKVRGADDFHYSVQLPPHSAISIGHLDNDRYNAHDQHFINDRVFNLRRIVLNEGDKKTEITNINFDSYFYTVNNEVIYLVQSVNN